MSTKRITGIELEKMMRNGLANLSEHVEEINRLNVFPVPDGDTGTNMYLTLENGIKYAKTSAEAGAYLKTLSEGMLLGARGNSGVILSQFYKGFYLELSRCAVIGPGELRNGLIRGYRNAYAAVVHPVEGTILSVAREGIEHIRSSITRNSTIENILSMYIAEMRKTLAYTPEMLSVLKEAGVVDSGAMGFILITEGMLKALYGDILKLDLSENAPAAQPLLDLSLFNENSEFTDGYCMEFILQRLKNQKYRQDFSVKRFINNLKLFGNSLVVVEDGTRVKVHVHTLTPSKVILLAQQFGEFLTFKLDNMQVQHNEHDRIVEKKPYKPLSVVCVVNGDGMKKLFEDLGCDVVIDGGSTMNTSSQEFIDAFRQTDADAIAVFPNNPNVIRAAEQAVSIYGKDNVTVIPTGSFAECYFALAMDIQDSSDVERRIAQMKKGAAGVATLSQTVASRDYSFHEISCRRGDEILLINGEIACVGDSAVDTIIDGLRLVDGIDDKETCIVLRGANVAEDDGYALEEAIAARYPMMDVELIDGGQEIYHWIIGVS